jgi:hypothetical protein
MTQLEVYPGAGWPAAVAPLPGGLLLLGRGLAGLALVALGRSRRRGKK